jgi:hypothetical protein
MEYARIAREDIASLDIALPPDPAGNEGVLKG